MKYTYTIGKTVSGRFSVEAESREEGLEKVYNELQSNVWHGALLEEVLVEDPFDYEDCYIEEL